MHSRTPGEGADFSLLETMRLEAGRLREQVVTRDETAHASRIWLINSLRGWIDVTLVA